MHSSLDHLVLAKSVDQERSAELNELPPPAALPRFRATFWKRSARPRGTAGLTLSLLPTADGGLGKE